MEIFEVRNEKGRWMEGESKTELTEVRDTATTRIEDQNQVHDVKPPVPKAVLKEIRIMKAPAFQPHTDEDVEAEDGEKGDQEHQKETEHKARLLQREREADDPAPNDGIPDIYPNPMP
jgi:hypothetical protein